VKRLAKNLTVQVLFAVTCSVLLGLLDPELGKAMKPVGGTFALAIGLAVVNITKPGAGLDISRLAEGDILQIVFFAVLFGFAAAWARDAPARTTARASSRAGRRHAAPRN